MSNKMLLTTILVFMCTKLWSIEPLNEYDVYLSDIEKHQIIYQKLSEKLKARPLNLTALKKIKFSLFEIKRFSKECVKNHKDILNSIYLLNSDTLKSPAIISAESRVNIEQKKIKLCQTLYFNAQDSLELISEQVQYANNINHNFSSENFSKIIKNIDLNTYTVSFKPIRNIFEVELNSFQYHLLLVYVFISLLTGVLISVICGSLSSKIFKNTSAYYLKITQKFSPVIFFFIGAKLYLEPETQDFLIKPTSMILLSIIISFLIILYIFFLSVKNCYYGKNAAWKIKIKNIVLKIIGLLFLLPITRFIFMYLLNSNPLNFVLMVISFLILSIICMLLFLHLVWIYTDPSQHSLKNKFSWFYLRWGAIIFITIYYCTIWYLNIIGYSGIPASNIIGYCFSYIFLIYKLANLLKNFQHHLENPSSKLSKKFYQLLRVNDHKNMVELTCLRYILLIYISLRLMIFFIELLGTPLHILSFVEDILFSPIQIGSASFTPIFILYAISIFCIIMVIGKILAGYTASRPYFSKETDRQATAYQLIRYITFCIALVVSWIILGVNMTQISVVLGGLCIGVGVGLQSPVLEFISSLIILFQKSIRVHDYISVNQYSGYVQKIMSLSTQIITDKQTIMYIPNSWFIKTPVINHSSFQSVNIGFIAFTVKNDHNIEQAKNIILQTALENPNLEQGNNCVPQLILYKLHDNTPNSNLKVSVPKFL